MKKKKTDRRKACPECGQPVSKFQLKKHAGMCRECWTRAVNTEPKRIVYI